MKHKVNTSPSSLLLKMILLNVLVVIGFSWWGWAETGNPGRRFGEGQIPTYISFLQLISISILAWRIFRQRSEGAPWLALRSERFVWAAISAGFFYLSLDEAFGLHERLGKVMHIPDEFLLAFYGLIGIITMALCHREIRRYGNVLFVPLAVGFVVLVFAVLADVMTHRERVALVFALNPESDSVNTLKRWFDVADNGFTLIAEGSFLAGFYHAFRKSASEAVERGVNA